MTRRPPKRKPAPPKVDNEALDESLALVASLMAEEKSYGWFSLPWRDTRNAMHLAYEAAYETAHIEGRLGDFCKGACGPPGSFSGSVRAAWDYLSAVKVGDAFGSYIASGDHMAELLFADDSVGRLTVAALRCHQLWETKADGSVPNLLLEKVLWHRDDPRIEAAVREARARDAIGTSTTFRNDGGDHTRRAFRYFWDQGLYATAYNLKGVL